MRKTDRTARLVKVVFLLGQNPNGLTVQEIADRCDVKKRTAYRDLDALQDIMGIPIGEEGSKRFIVEGYILPPIYLTLPEALNVFLTARLMLSYAHRYDPNVASIFTKLNSIVQPPLRQEIQKTLDWMRQQAYSEKYLRILSTLVEAWLSRRQVKISYWELEADKAAERIIDPYFIEPSAISHSVYVIAYCHSAIKLLRFKIERIEAIEATSVPYVIPADFDANAYFGSAWGIVVEDEVTTVRLKFTPELARIMVETKYHPSQTVETQRDGSLIMTLRVGNTVELYSWIMGWGEKVEVLEPQELRREIIRTAEAMLGVYKKKKPL